MKRLTRIDSVLRRPQVRAEFEEYSRLFAGAAGEHGAGDEEAHLSSALEAATIALRIVGAVRAEPANANLPKEEVYRYLANLAMEEMVGPLAKADRIRLSELEVRFPSGRPPTRRPKARQALIEEIRARPDMPFWRIIDRAHVLGVWPDGQADDEANIRRRVNRLRRDATK